MKNYDLRNKILPHLYVNTNDHRSYEEKADALVALFEQYETETRLDTINKVFEMSPSKSFNLWKPPDAFKFYQGLKTYEDELKDKLGD